MFLVFSLFTNLMILRFGGAFLCLKQSELLQVSSSVIIMVVDNKLIGFVLKTIKRLYRPKWCNLVIADTAAQGEAEPVKVCFERVRTNRTNLQPTRLLAEKIS